VPVFVNTFFETRAEQLFSLAELVERAFASAGLEYRVVGGLAVYLYVEEREPDAGRLTRDIDITVRREDLAAIVKAVEPFGLQYRHVAGADMLVQAGEPSARRAVHLIFSEIGEWSVISQIRVGAAADLIRMKLTSFRLKDEMHLKDLDEAGVITPQIESALSAIQQERLRQMPGTLTDTGNYASLLSRR
jgi:hypothetical protein